MTKRFAIGAISLLALAVCVYALWPLMSLRQMALLPLNNFDDAAYETRIQTAALGRWDEVTNGITRKEDNIRGVVPGVSEWIKGVSLGWTGLRGPEIALVWIVVFATLFPFVLLHCLRMTGASWNLSVVGTFIYTLIFIGTLQRVHLSVYLPLTVGVLWLIGRVMRRPSYVSMAVLGATLGLLPWTYFWSWTFLWATTVCASVLILVREKKTWLRTTGMIGVGILLLLCITHVYFVHQLELKLHVAAFADAGSYRNGLYPGHWPESPMRSALLVLLSFSSFALWWRQKNSSVLPTAAILGITIGMHQNLIHGIDFMLSSHYYPFVCIAAVLGGVQAMLFWQNSPYKKTAIVSGIAVVVLLAAAAKDYSAYWLTPFTAPLTRYAHLAPALEKLRDGNRQTILSDPETSLHITSWTDDSVVFTRYVAMLYVTNDEYVERACTAELFAPTVDVEKIAWDTLQYRGASLLPSVLPHYQTLCDEIRSKKAATLKHYGVDMLLWDEKLHPDWKIDHSLFTLDTQGDGWSLWRTVAK